MIKEDTGRIIQGQVFYQKQWMPIEKKVALEARNRKKIEEGYVYYQGEWITIEEKLARVSPEKPQKQEPQKVIITQTFNQQTYNIQHHTDKRIIHEHEHKHIHVDAETLTEYAKNRQNLVGTSNNLSIENGEEKLAIKGKQVKQITDDKSHAHLLEDKSGAENSNSSSVVEDE